MLRHATLLLLLPLLLLLAATAGAQVIVQNGTSGPIVNLNDGVTVTVGPGGVVLGGTVDGLLLGPNAAVSVQAGGVVRSGTPNNADDGIEVVNGNLSVINSGLIDARGGGEAIEVANGNLILTNAGVIFGDNNGVRVMIGSATILNSGTINTVFNNAGIAVVNGNLFLSNLGRVEGGEHGVDHGGGTARIINGGTIVGRTDDGVNIRQGTVLNNGLIQGNGDGVQSAFAGTFLRVDNHGQILGGSNGIQALNSGPVDIFNTGLIVGGTGSAIRSVGPMNLTNFGTIRSNGGGMSSTIQTGGGRIDNFGLIDGTNTLAAILGTAGPVQIFNHGRITGGAATILLGGGNDLLETFPGSTLTGTVNMGGGNDTVNLRGGLVTGNIAGGNQAGDVINLFGSGSLPGNVTQFPILNNFGNWNLLGLGNNITGEVFVRGGRLNVHGSLGGADTVSVFAGATLGGHGTITPGVMVFPFGRVDPGGSIGTLTLGGNITFQRGSALVIELQGRGDLRSDQLIVAGTLNAQPGSVLAPVIDNGYLKTGDRFRAVTAGAINGNFIISRPSAVIGVQAVQTATTIDLVVQRSTYASLADSRNRHRIALGLDSVVDSAGGDLRQVLNEMDKLQLEELNLAFESIDPEFFDVFREVGLMSYRGVAEAVEGHFSERGEGGGLDVAGNMMHDWNDLLADGGGRGKGDGREGEEWRASGFSVWAGAYGTFAENDEETDVTEFELRSTGPRMGWDYQLSDMFSIGMFSGITISDMTFERSNDMTAEHEAFTIGMHGHFEHPMGIAATLMVYGGVDDYEARRVIRFGTIDRFAESDHDGYHIAGRLAGEYIWSTGPFHLGPVASLDYLHQGQESFTEHGASSLDLRVKEREVDSFETGLGLVFRYRDESPDPGDMVWVPEVRAKWVREWLDDDRAISAALVGGPRFRTEGDDPTRDSAVIGFGFKVHDRSWFSFGLDYDAVINEDIESHTVRGAFEIRF